MCPGPSSPQSVPHPPLLLHSILLNAHGREQGCEQRGGAGGTQVWVGWKDPRGCGTTRALSEQQCETNSPAICACNFRRRVVARSYTTKEASFESSLVKKCLLSRFFGRNWVCFAVHQVVLLDEVQLLVELIDKGHRCGDVELKDLLVGIEGYRRWSLSRCSTKRSS